MYKLLVIFVVLASCYAAPGHLGGFDSYGHGGGHAAELVAIKPVQHVAKPVWNPWQSNSGWNGWNPLQANPEWNPWQQKSSSVWQQNNAWNPWQQNSGWNPWQQGHGHHAPSTSYAQVTSYKVQHVQPVVKTIIPTYAHGHGYHH